MLLLFDIGNTHTHLGLANGRRVMRQVEHAHVAIGSVARRRRLREKICRAARNWRARRCAASCHARHRIVRKTVRAALEVWTRFELTPKTVRGVGIDYPKPDTIGPDRLANAVAARKRFGAPVVVVDFGTAVTFDVVNRAGNYAGGIIAPGLAAMTDYLHEKTALLPRIKIREVKTVVGKSTEQAMLVGAVHGYRGLVRELIAELKRELKVKHLPVVATGGYARIDGRKVAGNFRRRTEPDAGRFAIDVESGERSRPSVISVAKMPCAVKLFRLPLLGSEYSEKL